MLKKQSGVNIIELMITLFIAGILAAIAMPAYNFYMQNTRALTLSTDFTTALAYARTEALKRGAPVSICSASDNSLTACGGNNTWANGWIIFSDPNGDGVLADINDRLRVHEALPIGTTFTTAQARITYDGTGFITAGAGSYTLMAPGCSGNHGRTVTLSNTGRANVAETVCT